jgi:hypothetical protein
MLNPFAPLIAFAQRAIPFTAPSPAPVVVTIRVTHLAKKALQMHHKISDHRRKLLKNRSLQRHR